MRCVSGINFFAFHAPTLHAKQIFNFHLYADRNPLPPSLPPSISSFNRNFTRYVCTYKFVGSDGVPAEALEPGLNSVFPNIKATDIPTLAITIKQTPDASEFWIAGINGQVSKVSEAGQERNGKGIRDRQADGEQKKKKQAKEFFYSAGPM